VVVWAFDAALAVLSTIGHILQVFTFHSLIKQGMVLLLLPTMTALTTRLLRTTFVVLCDKSAWLPILTDFMGSVIENTWLSPEVLPIMRVHALSFVVLLVEWTPFGFEVEHVKIGILRHLMNKPSLKLFSTMCK